MWKLVPVLQTIWGLQVYPTCVLVLSLFFVYVLLVLLVVVVVLHHHHLRCDDDAYAALTASSWRAVLQWLFVQLRYLELSLQSSLVFLCLFDTGPYHVAQLKAVFRHISILVACPKYFSLLMWFWSMPFVMLWLVFILNSWCSASLRDVLLTQFISNTSSLRIVARSDDE